MNQKKASQQEAPYFLTMLMTCALSCATKFDMDNALLKCHGQGKKKYIEEEEEEEKTNPDDTCDC